MGFGRDFDSPAGEFGRRRFLIGAGVALTGASGTLDGAEFWNAKDPSAWTEDEVRIITTNSPWARAAVPSYKGADDPTEDSGGGPMGRGRGGGMRRRVVTAAIIVRWESAQPILDALRAPLAADLEGHYVVSVTNLPVANARPRGRGSEATPDDTLERLQNGATLQAKGKDPAEAGIARRTHIGSILFGFSKDYLRLTRSDRDIVFTLDTEQLSIKAKFDGKDMTYHGKLAV
jgi:hypothetical protein